MRVIPADFTHQRERLGGVTLLARHYKAGHKMIARWIAELGLPPAPQPGFKQVPSDLSQVAPTMTRAQLARHYRSSDKVISRWLCEAGISPKSNRRTYFKLSKRGADIPPARRETPSDLAADYLRRFGPVSRCYASGAFSLTGDHCRVGNIILTRTEIIQRAEWMRQREAA